MDVLMRLKHGWRRYPTRHFRNRDSQDFKFNLANVHEIDGHTLSSSTDVEYPRVQVANL